MRPIDDPCSLTPDERFSEVASILAAGVLRLHARAALSGSNLGREEPPNSGPAVARKNFYGSGSLWSGRLAAAMFSLLPTLARWRLDPRRWLTWYLESCAEAGGRAPEDIQPFLPWNLSDDRRAALAMRTTTVAATDTS